MSNRGHRTGLYATAIEPIRAKGTAVTPQWLMAELKIARVQAYHCLAHLAKKHVLRPEARGVYSYVA